MSNENVQENPNQVQATKNPYGETTEELNGNSDSATSSCPFEELRRKQGKRTTRKLSNRTTNPKKLKTKQLAKNCSQKNSDKLLTDKKNYLFRLKK